MRNGIEFAGYAPGVIAEVVRLHMEYYAPAWGFGAAFEAKLAQEIGAFHDRFDADRDLFLGAFDGRRQLLGTISIDGADADGAHLRWFIVAPRAQGRGLGAELMRRAVSFVRRKRYRQTYLTTFRGLDAARAIYERHGFRLVAEEAEDPWSGTVGLQRYERPEA